MKSFYTILTIFSAVTFHALLTFCALGAPENYAIADDGTVKGRDKMVNVWITRYHFLPDLPLMESMAG